MRYYLLKFPYDIYGGGYRFMNISSCGINCDSCQFKSEQNCPGCYEHKGKPFWGVCELYSCASDHGHNHCGKCDMFPCQKLIEAHNGENPDGSGIEIENLRKLVDSE